MILRAFTLILLFSLLSAPVFAQQTVISDTSTETVITLYTDSYSGIYDVRNVNLQQGENHVLINGIPRMHDLSNLSAWLDGAILESGQNMYYGGIERLYKNLIGKNITLSGPEGSFSGTVEDFENGVLFLKGDDNGFHIIPNIHQYRLSTANREDIISNDPDARLRLRANRSGNQDLELFYVSRQLGWYPEHRVTLNDETGKLHWQTFGVVTNSYDHAFENVTLRFFSGEINLDGGGYHSPRLERSAMMMDASGDAGMERSAEGDHYIYRYPRKTDLLENERRQILLHEFNGIDFEKVYRYNLSVSGGNRVNGRPNIMLHVETDGENGLNETLPGGLARFINSGDEEGPVVQGEARLPFITAGDRLRVALGRASEITISEVRETVRSSRHETNYEIEATFRNNRDRAVQVVVHQDHNSQMTLTGSNIDHTREGNELTWVVDIEAGGTAVLRMSVNQNHQRN